MLGRGGGAVKKRGGLEGKPEADGKRPERGKRSEGVRGGRARGSFGVGVREKNLRKKNPRRKREAALGQRWKTSPPCERVRC